MYNDVKHTMIVIGEITIIQKFLFISNKTILCALFKLYTVVHGRVGSKQLFKSEVDVSISGSDHYIFYQRQT